MEVNSLTNQPVSDEALAGIAELAARQLQLEIEVRECELTLAAKQEVLQKYRDVLIPDAMLSVGMESFTLKDGTAVSIGKFYSASIPKDKQTEAFAWLRSNNYSEIIKREIKCKFGKGEDERATAVVMELAKQKIPFEDKESVHPQTLKAFVREAIEGGRNLPTDLLGVYVGNRAKVTPATK